MTMQEIFFSDIILAAETTVSFGQMVATFLLITSATASQVREEVTKRSEETLLA
jgi:hypothetical protein